MTKHEFVLEQYCDELGPAKVVQLYDPRTQMRGIVVIDNIACGPAIGGVRMAPDVTTQEVFRLACAMTLKNAAAGLPHGGGKAGIVADPKTADKPEIVRAFARAIRCLDEYIPGPDMGTDETCMAWVKDETGRSVGLPRVVGGIPLDELGATGYGLAKSAEVAAEWCKMDLSDATVAIEGYGNVGQHAARFLAEYGVKMVAASDSRNAIYDPNGLDIAQLTQLKHEKRGVGDYPDAEVISREQLFNLPCDILVPAARPDSIHSGNVNSIQAKLILQGAEHPGYGGGRKGPSRPGHFEHSRLHRERGWRHLRISGIPRWNGNRRFRSDFTESDRQHSRHAATVSRNRSAAAGRRHGLGPRACA